MINVKISESMREEALRRAALVPALNNSITDNHGVKVAMISDMMVEQTLGGRIVSHLSYDFDWISDKFKLFEIKAKERNVKPDPWHNCTVYNYNTKQRCEYYLFTSVYGNHSEGWIIGYIGKEDFYEQATFFKKGQSDPDERGGKYVFPADCYNLKIEQLTPLS